MIFINPTRYIILFVWINLNQRVDVLLFRIFNFIIAVVGMVLNAGENFTV